MTLSENPSQYTIKEYAIEGLDKRHHFDSPSFRYALAGKSQTFESIFLHSEKLIRYCQEKYEETGRKVVWGYNDKVAADCLTIDIDSKLDIPKAHKAAIDFVSHLRDEYGIDPNDLAICFSGYKGFHIQIPAELFGGFIPSKDLPRQHKILAAHLTRQWAHLVDYSIYLPVGLIRIENTRHKETDLYAIPLTFRELQDLSLDGIRATATNVRENVQRTNPRTLSRNPKLESLKYDLEQKLQTQPVSTTDDNNTYSYSALDIKHWSKLPQHCDVLKEIESKSKTGQLIEHHERVALGSIATAFGDNGKKKVHEILKTQDNYDRDKTEYYLNTMADSFYKPQLCEHICGPDGLCDAIKAINRRSPIAFAYTYDQKLDHKKKYVESFAVEKVGKHFSTLLYVTEEKAFYQYSHGVYKQIDTEVLKSMVCQFLPFYFPKEDVTNHRLNAVLERLKLERSIRFDGNLNADKYKLNLRNGIFDLESGTLSGHTDKFISSIQLPFEYDRKAKCPVFDKFMEETFSNDDKIINYMLKLWCYLLIPSYEFQKVWIWLGDGRNGKGTLNRCMTAMLGDENVAFQDVHVLAHDKFSPIHLKGKLVNFSTEMQTDDLDMTMIKKLSGGDQITAEYKNKDKINFKNYARLIVLANQLPRLSDVGPSVLERFVFIPFKHSIAEKDMDTRLDEKLAAELPGIFNRVEAKFEELVQLDGRISIETPEILLERRKDAIQKISSVAEFACERYVPGLETDKITLKSLYKEYVEWSHHSGYKPLGKIKFADVLRTTCKLRVDSDAGLKNQMCVYGIITAVIAELRE
jgi:putative DNA primase/helicase